MNNPRYAYDENEGFYVDMQNSDPNEPDNPSLGMELLPSDVVALLNAPIDIPGWVIALGAATKQLELQNAETEAQLAEAMAEIKDYQELTSDLEADMIKSWADRDLYKRAGKQHYQKSKRLQEMLTELMKYTRELNSAYLDSVHSSITHDEFIKAFGENVGKLRIEKIKLTDDFDLHVAAGLFLEKKKG